MQVEESRKCAQRGESIFQRGDAKIGLDPLLLATRTQCCKMEKLKESHASNQRLDFACSRCYPKAPESVPNALQPLKGSRVEKHKENIEDGRKNAAFRRDSTKFFFKTFGLDGQAHDHQNKRLKLASWVHHWLRHHHLCRCAFWACERCGTSWTEWDHAEALREELQDAFGATRQVDTRIKGQNGAEEHAVFFFNTD